MPMPNVHSNLFLAQMDTLEESFRETQRRMQVGYMLKAIAEMAEECPNVASFELSGEERHLECHNAMDADGETVSQEEHEALDAVFHYREEADYSLFVGETVVVADVIASWPYNVGRKNA